MQNCNYITMWNVIIRIYLTSICSRRFRPRLTQPYNHIIYPFNCCQNLFSLLLKVSVVSADFTIFLASSIHLQFWVQKKIFLNHSDIYYLLILGDTEVPLYLYLYLYDDGLLKQCSYCNVHIFPVLV